MFDDEGPVRVEERPQAHRQPIDRAIGDEPVHLEPPRAEWRRREDEDTGGRERGAATHDPGPKAHGATMLAS